VWSGLFCDRRQFAENEGFTYHKGTDCFTCSAANLLPVKRFHSTPTGDSPSDTERSPAIVDAARANRPASLKARAARLFVRPTMPTAAKHWRGSKVGPAGGMRRLRQRTVEPVFGSLLQHYGLRRVNTRGRSGAHKTLLRTAIAFKWKKLLKHPPQNNAAPGRRAVEVTACAAAFALAAGAITSLAIEGRNGSRVLQQPLHFCLIFRYCLTLLNNT
jgi:hypothetical protein